MKKLLFAFPIVALLAAGCNSSQQASSQNPAGQNTNLAPKPITLSVNPTSLNLNIQQGATATSSPVLSVSLSSGATGLISTNVNYESGNGWLSTGNSIGSTPGSVVVSLNSSSLPVGSYSATISVSESGITTSVPVTLTVSAPAPTTTNPNSKTYTNTQYGFEFQYSYKNLSVADGYVSSVDPKGMVAVINIFAIPHGQDRDGEVRIFNLPLNEAALSVGFGSGALQTAKTVNRNGISWIVIYAPEGNVYGHYLTEKNGKTFWFDADSKISTSDFEAILNTFKFTK